MSDTEKSKEDEFSHMVGRKENQKIRAQRKAKHGLWFGLGMFGLIGWTVAVPTVLGTLLGIWLDHKFSGKQSWTLTFLLLGLITGCVSAWLWVSKEHNEMKNNDEE